MSTLDKYTQALFKLSPSGNIMPTVSDDSNLRRLYQTIGNALLQAQRSADGVTRDILPDNAGAYLTAWERALGLPLKGLEDLPHAQRLGFVKAFLSIGEFSNAEFMIRIAALAGYEITITEFTPADPPPAPADPDDAYLYFQINAPADDFTEFTCGHSTCGESLITFGMDALNFIINFFKPAHAVVLFEYT